MLTIFVLSIVTLFLKKIFALRGEHVPGESERVRERGGGDSEKGRKREPVNHFFYDALPPTFDTFEIIRFWQEQIN